MNFTPSFNAINDRQYIRPTYFNPETGSIQYNPYAPTPTPVSAPPTGMAMGMPSPGMDFFAQLAGLIGNQQRAPQSSYGGPLSGYADMARQNMELQKRAMEDQRMMMGIRTPGGVGPFGGVSKDIQNEIFKGRGRAMSGMQYGQPGRASGGRTATGYPQRPSQGFQPSTNFGNPRASEGFGNGRGFGSFR